MLSHHRNIGLAVSQLGISAVEIEQTGQTLTICHAAHLAFTPEADLEHPDALGRQLKATLRDNGMTSARCIIGLSSTWLATREKSSPATDAQSIRGIVSIAVERDFASGSQELMFDYSVSACENGLTMLLAAAPRKVVDQLLIAAKVAGLTILAVTSSIASLAMADRGTIPSAGRLVLCLGLGGVELILQNPRGIRLIRNINTNLNANGQLASMAIDCRRILAMASSDSRAAAERQLLIWNPAGISHADMESFAAGLGCCLQVGKFPADLGISGGATQITAAFASAAALAGCNADGLALDFLHSKLAVPKKPVMSRGLLWIAAAAAVVIGLVVYLALDVSANQKRVDDLTNQLNTLREPLRQAKEIIDKTSFASTWYDRRPPILDCMLEITGAFPNDSSIWATSLTIEEEGKTGPATTVGPSVNAASILTINLHGKALNDKAAFGVLDRLKSNPRIIILKPLSTSQVGGSSREVSFSILLGLRGVS